MGFYVVCIVLGIVFSVIIFYLFVTLNSLMKLKNLVEEAFYTMDVYLKKRWNLVPNVVETVKGYAEHEKRTLEEIVRLRNTIYEDMSSKDKMDVDREMFSSFSRLMALAERYPELKASEQFGALSKELSKLEEDIANARKYYNGTVRKMNDKVQMFPSNLVAKVIGFKTYPMFETTDEARLNVEFNL